jgi:hypothetical protein
MHPHTLPSAVNLIAFDPFEGADEARFYGAKYTSKTEAKDELRTTETVENADPRSASGTLQWMRGRCLGLPLGANGMLGFAMVQGWMAGSESVEFWQNPGSGSEMQMALAPSLTLIARCSSMELQCVTAARPNPGSGSELFRASHPALPWSRRPVQ